MGGGRILFGAPPAVLLRGSEQNPETPSPTSPFRKEGMANAVAVSSRLPWLLLPQPSEAGVGNSEPSLPISPRPPATFPTWEK